MTMTNNKRRASHHRPASRSAFRISPVAAACSALILATGAAHAQSEPAKDEKKAEEQVQTVTVTGIRRGIEAAIAIKKNADSIVEAISAEDIGKLPDTSVAESISRLPGVTTQRSTVTGRAQQISVRGMAPDFNGGLLNGREQASTGSSRSVEFDQYPAELLGSIVIYKTPDASLMGQGLSSTTDMQTVRPLNFGERNIVVNYRHESTGKAEDKPGFGTGSGDRASLSYIDQFADRTVGLALGVTHATSKGGGRPNFNTWGGWVADVPYAGGTVKAPGGFTTDIETTDYTRDAGLMVLQFKPNKDFESTLDVLYSKGEFSVMKRGLEGPVGGLSAGANDTGGTLINATVVDGIATSGTLTNWKGVIRNHNEDYTDELQSIGWGNTFKAGDWKLNFDLSHSKVTKVSERFETTAGIPGNATRDDDTISWTGFNGTNLADVQYTSGLNYADPNLIKLTDVQGWAGANGVQDGYYANPTTTDKIDALKLQGTHDVAWGPIVSVTGGLNTSIRTKDRVTREGALVLPGALDADGNVVDRLVWADIPNPSTGVGGMTGIPTLNWNPAGSLGSVYQLNPWSDHDIVGKTWGVKENVSTAYLKGDIDSDVAGIPLRGNVGVQFIATRQSATGFQVDQASCNGGTHSCDYSPTMASHSFTDVLPSLNLAADLGNDNVVRFGLGRLIARPNMEDMKSTIDFSVKSDDGPSYFNGSGGNPALEPFRANALDLSYEKYFGRKGYVSIAGFYKDLDTYILKTRQVFDFAPYVTPGSGMPDNGTVGLITLPTNGKGGTISGVELAVNVPLSMATSWLDGFGVMANYSNTDSSVKLPASGFSGQNVNTPNIPLPGLSREVTNIRLYYEKYGFQIAVAQRHRSEYLGSISDYQDKTQLVYVKAESQVDVQLAYDFDWGPLKGLSLLAQGNNLTNAEYAEYDAANGNITNRKKFGTSYMVGLNYKF
ncbi:TonB-dependent receptor [Ideonella sp.]|uniref:TonB-dependent receptor n=1 Tax=Ideonella sp. TaxID=1929293 RepID=UPI002B483F24|nr:TonB-dependent receptor [Ideonella sp.]HJV70997.1 TonB-dependent receptor [Ideonella sp.]